MAFIYHYNYLINIHKESHISNIKNVVESPARVEEGVKRQFSLVWSLSVIGSDKGKTHEAFICQFPREWSYSGKRLEELQ